MHLGHLEVSNFRALDSATLPNLPANVVIAGPNGCGKSTIFDAIRLWKSAYGGLHRERVRRFVDTHGDGLEYEVLRNLVIARMRAAGFEPPGMVKVIATIMAPLAASGTVSNREDR